VPPLAESPESRHRLLPGCVDAPHGLVSLGDFSLTGGGQIANMRISYADHGHDGVAQKPVVLVLSAIGSTHHRLDFLIGPGRALDPRSFRILAVDAIGNGLTSSPSNSPGQSGRIFPRFGIDDMVHSQHALLAQLGIRQLHAVVGASMGGMQALAWAVLYPGFARRVVALTPMAKTTPWARLINLMARAHLEAGLARVERGAPPHDVWTDWVPLMQAASMRTPSQFDCEIADSGHVETWLAAQTRAWIAQGFDPLDWIWQSCAYDAFDVGLLADHGGDTDKALASICVPTLVGAPPLDLYNPVEAAHRVACHVANCRWVDIQSNYGHLAASALDPNAALALNGEISNFLAN
jgi:homoserine O-acetyltransferase